MEDQPLRNPFRSETDAFRLLLIVGAAVGAVVLAFALGGPWVGAAVTVLLLGAATRASYRWLRQAVAAPDEDGDEGVSSADGA